MRQASCAQYSKIRPFSEQIRDGLPRILADPCAERDPVAALDCGDRVELDAGERTDRLLHLAAGSTSRPWRVSLCGDRKASQGGHRDRPHSGIPTGSRSGYGGAVAEWDPDVEIDATLVRGILVEQFPDLDASSVRLLGEGFDNSVWSVEDTWAFRFPRRLAAVQLVDRELQRAAEGWSAPPDSRPDSHLRRQGERPVSQAVLRPPDPARRRAG